MTYPKAIIFDFDGTLIHSAPDLQSAVNAALGVLGRQSLDLPTVISFIGNGVETLVERSMTATGGYDAPLRQAALDLFLESYSRNMTTLTWLYPGALSALQSFRMRASRLASVRTNRPELPMRFVTG